MSTRMFAIVLVLALAACGGGGSGSASSFTPQLTSQGSSSLGNAVMPASSGTVASGYIECDNAVNIAAGNNCNNYANFSPAPSGSVGGTFAFTAIAASPSGAPILTQSGGAGALGFANGSVRVVEAASGSPAIVSISGGPWSTPGGVLSGNGGSYGNAFTVQCVRTGTAQLQLQLVTASGAQSLPLATGAYSTNVTAVNCSASGSLTIL
jgi:hypothetical protein